MRSTVFTVALPSPHKLDSYLIKLVKYFTSIKHGVALISLESGVGELMWA